MDYRFLGKRKTLALGVYPAVSLASARKRRDEARTLLAEGIDPSQAKQEGKYARTAAAAQTFEVVANQWLLKIAPSRSASTQDKVKGWRPRTGSNKYAARSSGSRWRSTWWSAISPPTCVAH